MAISLLYHKLFTIGVDSLMMLKWSHVTDITNSGLIQPSFFYSVDGGERIIMMYVNSILTELCMIPS